MKLTTTAIILILAIAATAIFAADSTKTPTATPKPKTIVPKAKIVDFEGKKSPLEFRWIGVNDSIMQGASKITVTVAPDGAAGTKQSLKLEGAVIAGTNPYIMFAGAATRFADDNTLSDVTSYTGIKFWAKGDGNTYRIDLPAAVVTDYMFHYAPFTPPTGEWREYKIAFADLKQAPYGKRVAWTGTDVQGVQFFTVGGPIAKFTLQVDEIEFYK
jgi:hypothetical protein